MAKRTVVVVSRRDVAVVEDALLRRLQDDVALAVAVEGVDHVGDRRDALVGDALLEDTEPAGVAEPERARRAAPSSPSPKSTCSPFGRSGAPVWPTRAPGAMPETSATASSWAGVP